MVIIPKPIPFKEFIEKIHWDWEVVEFKITKDGNYHYIFSDESPGSFCIYSEKEILEMKKLEKGAKDGNHDRRKIK